MDFFAGNPVFSHEEFIAARASATGASLNTTNNVLAHHLAAGHLVRVRRGLYATVPRGVRPDTAGVDPYLIATKLTDDAVVAYHAALQYHGKAYSLWNRYAYFTRHRARPMEFRGSRFPPVQLPAALRSLPDTGGGVVEQRHAGGRCASRPSSARSSTSSMRPSMVAAGRRSGDRWSRWSSSTSMPSSPTPSSSDRPSQSRA